jgi:hypothetical protein
MLIKPSEYNGENVLKLSVLVKLSLDIIALAKEFSDDPALLIDLQAIYADIEDLIANLEAMELPQMYSRRQEAPGEDEQK